MAATSIGLVMEHTLDFYREVLHGIREFGHKRPHWIFVPIKPDARSLRSSRVKNCDGFVGHISTLPLASAMRNAKRPWVNVSTVHPKLTGPRVMVDHCAVGRLAAEYFIDRGFRTFAYVGYRDHLFSMGRLQGFKEVIQSRQCEVQSHFEERIKHSDPTSPHDSSVALHRWISSLPLPIAVFASNDVQGFRIAEACREQEIQIPEQMALMSVDNDKLLCDLAQPPLSSVALPTRQIGYEAAKLLDRLMRGSKPPRRPILLPPTGIVERASSNITAINNETVARALKFIRSHAHERIGVSDVCSATCVSRRLLERSFRRLLQRTVADEIRLAHMEIARRLLAQTQMSMADIARAAGFTDAKHFATVFRRVEGTTPTNYRGRRNED